MVIVRTTTFPKTWSEKLPFPLCFRPYERSKAQVRADFPGVKLPGLMANRLGQLDEANYEFFKSHVESFQKTGTNIIEAKTYKKLIRDINRIRSSFNSKSTTSEAAAPLPEPKESPQTARNASLILNPAPTKKTAPTPEGEETLDDVMSFPRPAQTVPAPPPASRPSPPANVRVDTLTLRSSAFSLDERLENICREQPQITTHDFLIKLGAEMKKEDSSFPDLFFILSREDNNWNPIVQTTSDEEIISWLIKEKLGPVFEKSKSEIRRVRLEVVKRDSSPPIQIIVITFADNQGKPIAVIALNDSSAKEDGILESLSEDRKRTYMQVFTSISRLAPLLTPTTPLKNPETLAGDLYNSVAQISQFHGIGPFKVATLNNPGATLNEDLLVLLAGGLNWYYRDIDDMRRHLEGATELHIAFDGIFPIAFGAGLELQLVNNRRTEHLLVMAGTMTKPGYFGHGLQTIVNGLFMTASRWRHKFRVPYPIMRTRSVVPAVGFMRHFSSVTFESLDRYQFLRAMAFSRNLGGACDTNGITLNAYQQPVMDKERDEQVLANLRGAVTQSHFSGFSVSAESIIAALKNAGFLNENNEVTKKVKRSNKKFRPSLNMGTAELTKIHKILRKAQKEKDLKIYDKVTRAFNGLSEKDARVFQGKLTWWKAFKILLYVLAYGLFDKNGRAKKKE